MCVLPSGLLLRIGSLYCILFRLFREEEEDGASAADGLILSNNTANNDIEKYLIVRRRRYLLCCEMTMCAHQLISHNKKQNKNNGTSYREVKQNPEFMNGKMVQA